MYVFLGSKTWTKFFPRLHNKKSISLRIKWNSLNFLKMILYFGDRMLWVRMLQSTRLGWPVLNGYDGHRNFQV